MILDGIGSFERSRSEHNELRYGTVALRDSGAEAERV